MNLEIRNYENSDYETVKKILIEAFPEIKEFMSIGINDEQALVLDKNKYIQLVAVINEEVVGYSLASRSYDPIKQRTNLWIDYVCVNKEYRGKGIAKHLLQKIEELAKNENILFLQLTSSRFRTSARKLYIDLGFSIRESDIFRKVLD